MLGGELQHLSAGFRLVTCRAQLAFRSTDLFPACGFKLVPYGQQSLEKLFQILDLAN